MGDTSISLSIIVPAHNSQRTILECLHAIRRAMRKEDELIVADDGSEDNTASIAESCADRVIRLPANMGPAMARQAGIAEAKGDVIVGIDSDIVVSPDTFSKIRRYFANHKDVAAVTGLLSRQHPHTNFFSQYKNLYMHHVFTRLPEHVTFLYGSIYALRRSAAPLLGPSLRAGEDTAWGQHLWRQGQAIAFLRELQVMHLKRHGFCSFIKNDFRIPFHWAGVFLGHGGWRQLGRMKTGYAHAPKEQLVSVILTPVILALSAALLFWPGMILLLVPAALAWTALNVGLMTFLAKQRGVLFGLLACPVTFLDHIIMSLGIAAGTFAFLIKKTRRKHA